MKSRIDQRSCHEHVVLMTCGALAPALMAPTALVSQLLSNLELRLGDMPSLRKLASKAADVSMKGIHFPTALIRADDKLDRWSERLSELRQETTNWLSNESGSTNQFRAATRVWKRILEDWGNERRSSIGKMFALLKIEDDLIDVDRLSQIAEYWRINCEKEIDRIDRDNRGRISGREIEGAARQALRNKVDQAIAFSNRWISILSERPQKRPQFHEKLAGELRTTVISNAGPALREINATATPLMDISAELLKSYKELFEGTTVKSKSIDASLAELLNGDLLADPSIGFDRTSRPIAQSFDPNKLVSLLERDALDFGDAAYERARLGDFHGAELAVDFAQRTERIEQQIADQCNYKIEEERLNAQAKLKEQITVASNRLDAAYAAGALTLQDYEELRDLMPEHDSLEDGDFRELDRDIEQIGNAIHDAQADRREKLARSLQALRPLSSEEQARVKSAIDDDSFQVAEDLIERIERGEELPRQAVESDRPFEKFFPGFVGDYSNFCHTAERGIDSFKQEFQGSSQEDFIRALGLSNDARRDGIVLLDAWATLHENVTSVSALQTLMDALGFDNASVKGSDDRTLAGEPVFMFESTPIADRRIARLPDFGSRANGKYRLLAIRKLVTVEAIVREALKSNTVGDPPNIVLFLNVLDVDARQALAHELSLGESHPTLVLDEALIAFLATRSDDRLSAFFDCTSAFAFSQPYDPDAVEVPPEMFFGRSDERRKVLAMSGDTTHFVYGGRRLGKTALLTTIAREHHRTQQDGPEQLVMICNLRGSGIGENRPTDELWLLFARLLAEHRVLNRQTVRPEAIESGIKQWLEEGLGRRILFLVDEADAFLDAERLQKKGYQYQVLDRIKRLMEETERKFKVVFAGLHNVQRAARDPNTPFAHLGDAVRIGPMLPETDGDEIQELIRSPLEALGYRFVSNDSIIRIAAETNYYPALAQQFCKELLKTLREQYYAKSDTAPPYLIDADAVDRIFNARETRDRIRNLFSWTIHLDPRYEFLTYLIAQRSFDEEEARPKAVEIEEIQNAALSEWPEGFESEKSYWMFEVLMEEMVGLGILREVGDKRYGIRTRNLRVLLGNDEEIERRFADAKSKQPPSIFDPSQFRSTLAERVPSTLTADQEHRLLSGRRAVGLVFGTILAGLDRMRESLKKAVYTGDEELDVKEAKPASLTRTLLQVSKSRKPGIHVILVDLRGEWDPKHVSETLDFVAKGSAQNRLIRPVFLCGPDEAWQWLTNPIWPRKDVECREVWLGPCSLEFTRNWLRDHESLSHECRDNLGHPVDQPWPAIAGIAATNTELKTIAEAVDFALDREANDGCVSDILISNSARTTLRILTTFCDVSMTADDLSELCQDDGQMLSPDEAGDFFNWANRLGIVYRDGNGYRLDSTFVAGLKRLFAE